MVGVGEGDHKLSGVLDGASEVDAGSKEKRRVHDATLVPQKLTAYSSLIRKDAGGQALELLALRVRDCIPANEIKSRWRQAKEKRAG